MMIYNILNGDSLAYSFPDTKIQGDVIVIREGLIDGDLSGDNLYDFWQSRAKYMGLTENQNNNGRQCIVPTEDRSILDEYDKSDFTAREFAELSDINDATCRSRVVTPRSYSRSLFDGLVSLAYIINV